MASLTNQRVGLIGVGLMGKGMARHLRQAGAEVHIANRSQPALDELAAEGMRVHASPAALAQVLGAAPVIVMVADTPAVAAALLGEQGVIKGLAAGALVIDMGTTAVAKTQEFAATVKALGAGYVDAPVSGGQVAANDGTMTIMAGGSESDFARALPFFQAMGRNITHLGAVGAGQVAKIANQMIVAMTLDAVAEAFALAEGAGVAAGPLRQALLGGFAASRILELHGQRMVDRKFTPGGRARIQRKDIAQALELADQVGIDLPALKLNLTHWDKMIAQGDGDLDHSGIIRIYRR